MALTNVWLAGYGGPAIGATAVWIAPNDGTVPSATQVTLVGWNGPVSGATPVWIAGYGGPPPVAIGAIPICIKGWSGSGGAAPPPTSVWSASDASANAMTLSNGGLTVAVTNGAYQSIRSTISHLTGKYYVEFLCNVATTDEHHGFGLADSGFNATSYLGTTNYSFGELFTGNNFVSLGFTTISIVPAHQAALNDVIQLAVDLTAGKIWIGLNNVWYSSGAPATGSNPMVTIGAPVLNSIALFPAFTSLLPGTGTWTLQTTAASLKYLPPPGFQAWDGGPVTPPASSQWNASDATANAMALSNGGLTVTSHTNSNVSIRGTNSLANGKVYIEFLTVASAGNVMLGLASSSFNASGLLGASNYSGGVAYGSNPVSTGFTSHYTTTQFPAVNDVWALAVDFSAGSIWLAQNNIWLNSSNPATGTLPIISFVLATVGALFPTLSVQDFNETWTLQSTAASQKYAPPAGFSAWG